MTAVMEQATTAAAAVEGTDAITASSSPTDLSLVDGRLPKGWYEHPEAAAALVARDIRAVYKHLQQHGVSQRRIATLTGQGQSEVCEIVAGRRVNNYDVLERIAAGLGVPRGLMGLAADPPGPVTPASAGAVTTDLPVAPAAAASGLATPTSGGAGPAYLPVAGRTDVLIFNVVSWNGVLIRAMREAKGLDRQGFAGQIGVSGSIVSKWELDGVAAGLAQATQLKLDHVLKTLNTDERTRFTRLINAAPPPELSTVDKADDTEACRSAMANDAWKRKLVFTSPTRSGEVVQQVSDSRCDAVAAGCVAVGSGRPAVVLALPVGFWDDPDIAGALRARDIAAVFRYLQDQGLSQRVIARYTGQAKSEVSEILAGRVIRSYDVLLRIAVGLGIPRGRLGLAYDTNTALLPVCDRHAGCTALVVEVAVFETPPTGSGRADRDARAVGRSVRRGRTAGGSVALLAAVIGMDAEKAAATRLFLASTITARPNGLITEVAVWSGLHVRVLRQSMRMTVRGFGDYLGVNDRQICKWEAAGADIQPRPVNQAALDTCFARLKPEQRGRFTRNVEAVLTALAASSLPDSDNSHRSSCPTGWDDEQWRARMQAHMAARRDTPDGGRSSGRAAGRPSRSAGTQRSGPEQAGSR